MELSGQPRAPATLPPGKDFLVSVVQEAGWVPEPLWTILRRYNKGLKKTTKMLSPDGRRPSTSGILVRVSSPLHQSARQDSNPGDFRSQL